MKQIACISIALLAAVAAWRDTAQAYYQARAPQSPPAFLASDPQIALTRLDQASRSATTSVSSTTTRDIETARQVLIAGPLDQVALRHLANAAERRGAPREGQRLLELSARITRRDLRTQLALVGAAARMRDSPGALAHLDRVIMVHPEVQELVYQQLTSAIDDREARKLLATYSARSWFQSYLVVASQKSAHPVNVADLVLSVGSGPGHVDEGVLSQLIPRLVAAGNMGLARRLALKSGRIAVRDIDTFGFTLKAARAEFAPLTWKLPNDERVQSRLVSDGVLEVEVTPGNAVIAAERVTAFSAGTYAFEQTVGGLAGIPPRLEWELSCLPAADGQPIWQQPVPVDERAIRYSSRISIPADCKVQRWRLSLSPGDSQAAARVSVSDIRLSRVR